MRKPTARPRGPPAFPVKSQATPAQSLDRSLRWAAPVPHPKHGSSSGHPGERGSKNVAGSSAQIQCGTGSSAFPRILLTVTFLLPGRPRHGRCVTRFPRKDEPGRESCGRDGARPCEGDLLPGCRGLPVAHGRESGEVANSRTGHHTSAWGTWSYGCGAGSPPAPEGGELAPNRPPPSPPGTPR